MAGVTLVVSRDDEKACCLIKFGTWVGYGIVFVELLLSPICISEPRYRAQFMPLVYPAHLVLSGLLPCYTDRSCCVCPWLMTPLRGLVVDEGTVILLD